MAVAKTVQSTTEVSASGNELRRLVRALGRIRTCDTRFRKPMLYPLSYEGGDCSCRSEGSCRWSVTLPVVGVSTVPVR